VSSLLAYRRDVLRHNHGESVRCEATTETILPGLQIDTGWSIKLDVDGVGVRSNEHDGSSHGPGADFQSQDGATTIGGNGPCGLSYDRWKPLFEGVDARPLLALFLSLGRRDRQAWFQDRCGRLATAK